MPGKMFNQGLLHNFTSSRKILQALTQKAFEANPELMSEPSLKPEQIAESLPKGKVLEFGPKRVEIPYALRCNVQLSFFDGVLLKDMVKQLSAVETDLQEKGYSNICFVVDLGMYPEDGAELTLYGERLETDKEEKARVANTKRQKILREKKKKNSEEIERRTYLRLKNKFENKNIGKK